MGGQYETVWFLRRLLPERRAKDAACLVAVTMVDLYPDDTWNYVFGEASLEDRVGVWSFARYLPAFWGLKETPESDTQALRRGLAVVVHEMGHAFGIEHCQWYACVMNGSNSLEESLVVSGRRLAARADARARHRGPLPRAPSPPTSASVRRRSGRSC